MRVYIDTSVIGGCLDEEFNEESIKIANAYIKEEAVTQENLMDARHIAIATVNKVDILVSWDFKHIVNIRRIHLFNSVI